MQQYQRETEQLLRLMRAALHGDFAGQIAWDEACRADELKTMILRQDLTAMVYPVIEKQTAAPWTRLAQELKEAFQRGIHKAVTQEYEIQALLDEMEADGIDCLPMKGWIMRDCYPDPLMRSMCDFDVLIRDMDSARMRAWMEARGYRGERLRRRRISLSFGGREAFSLLLSISLLIGAIALKGVL